MKSHNEMAPKGVFFFANHSVCEYAVDNDMVAVNNWF